MSWNCGSPDDHPILFEGLEFFFQRQSYYSRYDFIYDDKAVDTYFFTHLDFNLDGYCNFFQPFLDGHLVPGSCHLDFKDVLDRIFFSEFPFAESFPVWFDPQGVFWSIGHHSLETMHSILSLKGRSNVSA